MQCAVCSVQCTVYSVPVPVNILHNILAGETTGTVNNLEVGAARKFGEKGKEVIVEVVKEQEATTSTFIDEGKKVNGEVVKEQEATARTPGDEER